jgi:hypothetical protein
VICAVARRVYRAKNPATDVHCVTLVEVFGASVFGGQGAQSLAVWYVFAGHPAHPPPDSVIPLTNPEAHAQSVRRVAPPAAVALWSGHARHCAASLAPGVGWYVPCGQARHVDASVIPSPVEYAPAAHGRHSAAAARPSAPEWVPAGHGRHASGLLAPTVGEYSPAPHATQVSLAVAPTAVEWVPAGHASHAAPPAPYRPAGHGAQVHPSPKWPASHTHCDPSALESYAHSTVRVAWGSHPRHALHANPSPW